MAICHTGRRATRASALPTGHTDEQQPHHAREDTHRGADAEVEPEGLSLRGIERVADVAHDVPWLEPQGHCCEPRHKGHKVYGQDMPSHPRGGLIAERTVERPDPAAQRDDEIMHGPDGAHCGAIATSHTATTPIDTPSAEGTICTFSLMAATELTWLLMVRYTAASTKKSVASSRRMERSRRCMARRERRRRQRRPLRCCSFSICCCWRCISSRRAMKPLFLRGFLAFSAIVRRTSSSLITKRKA